MIALRSLGELVMRHKGARICVMGGGPSLADDIKRVRADIWISANDHGARLRPVDYVVAMDNLHTRLLVPMEGHIREHTDAPIIGPWHWCDYGITEYPLAPQLLFSGVVAMWVASVMGAHPLILAGFDCYGGQHRTMGQHKSYVPHIKSVVRVASGPLIGVWPQYDDGEAMAEYVPPDVFGEISMTHGVRVRVRKPVDIRGQTWPVGTVLHVPRQEVWRQLKHRSLIELAADEVAPQDIPVAPVAKRRGRPPKVRN